MEPRPAPKEAPPAVPDPHLLTVITSALPFLIALARAVPACDSLFRAIVAERDRDRAREARRRLAAKDAAVDAAIAGPSNAEAAKIAEAKP